LKKKQDEHPKEENIWVKGPSPLMANRVLDLIFGRAASRGALAPHPPRATAVGPEFHRYCPFPLGFVVAGLFSPFFFPVFEIGHLLV